ncbi:hypothetical protein AVEN_239269-1 [Araneus ventricosus]|uniref:Tc3 transposase DNA binding domain-containing protein n=1 Tax=Araneus ventricosus TaxID=182803 RepID=A0A4Y2P278_ARAVE|nr:hypothetical protein AVEN_239269-1 [Araneus ventricosus]
MIAGARSVGGSVMETANIMGNARSMVTEFMKGGKMVSAKYSSGRKSRLTNRDRRQLERIVDPRHKQSLTTVTSNLNRHP